MSVTEQSQPTAEMPAAAEPAAEYESCEHCEAPVEAAQRYCVVCGTRRKHVHDPASRFLAHATGHNRSARTGRPAARPQRRSAGLGLALALAAIPLAVAVGVLIARSGNDVNSKLLAALRAEKPPVVNVNGGGGSATTAGTTTPSATTTPASLLTSTFTLQKGYAVELQTLPGTGTTQATVSSAESKARSRGATAVGLIIQSAFKVTPAPPAGDYVIYSGQYSSSSAATAALDKLKHKFRSARVIQVSSTSAASGSSTPVLSTTQYGTAHQVTGFKATSSQLATGGQIASQESKEENGNYTKSQQGLPDVISVP
jgi:hypothetical protein